MNCRETQRYLDTMLLSGLDPKAQPALAAHTAQCARCNRDHQAALRTLELLRPSMETETPANLKETILMNIHAIDAPAPGRAQAKESTFAPWRPWLVASAAAIAVLAAIGFALQSVPPVYALEQTLAANQGLRAIHMRMAQPATEHAGEIWVELSEAGELFRLRMNFPDTADGPKDIVWEDGKAQVWFKQKNSAVVVREARMLDGLKRQYAAFDPKLLVESIYQRQRDGKANVEVSEPSAASEPVTLTVTVPEAPDRRDVYTVDAGSKLVRKHEVFALKDGAYALAGATEYLEYNEPIDPAVFVLDLPPDVMQIDQTAQDIGLVQGGRTDHEIAVEVVRQFFTALIDGDYAKAGSLMEGMPAQRLQELFGGVKFIRIVEIGEPAPYAPNQSLRVPCKIEAERNGQTTVFEPHGPYVRQVYGQPERWTICGGI